MDLGTQTLLSIALLLALNNALVRFAFMRTRTILFVGIQLLNTAVAVWLMARGIPGFESIPAVSWMLGLLLVLHVVQNIRWKRAVRAEAEEDDDKERRASAIRQALGDDG